MSKPDRGTIQILPKPKLPEPKTEPLEVDVQIEEESLDVEFSFDNGEDEQ